MTSQFLPFSIKKDTVRHRFLELLIANEGQKLYLSEIAGMLACDPTNLWRDLRKLEEGGLVISEMRGHQKYILLNRQYSYYDELKSILSKMGASQGRPLTKSGRSVYVIAGPNGAGKTTFAKTFLPEHMNCKVFINADLIAGGISPLKPDDAALRAGRFLLEEIRRTAKSKVDFGFETTLSGRSYIHLFRQFKTLGYEIHLIFLWIPNVQTSLMRIAERVKRGGHHIPQEVAERRFVRGIRNLFNLYKPFLDSWNLMDNSGSQPKTIAYEEARQRVVVNPKLFETILNESGRS